MAQTPAKNGNGVTVIKTGSETKTTGIILGVAAIATAGFFLNKYIKNAQENSTSDGYTSDKETSVQIDPKTGAKVTTTYNPTQIAAEYATAMGGSWDGTTTQNVMNLADKSKGDRWEKISEAFRKQTGTNLLAKVKLELNAAYEFPAFNSILNNASTHKFGGLEILSLKKITGVRVVNATTKNVETTSFIMNGSNLGKVSKRLRGTTSDTKYYVFEKYPNYWFNENDLMRAYDSAAYKIWKFTGI